MDIVDHVSAIKMQIENIIEGSGHRDLAVCYVQWKFPKLATAIGVPDACLYDTAQACGLFPTDSGRAWYAAENLLQAQYREETGHEPSCEEPFVDWLYKLADQLERIEDRTHELVTSIADQAWADFDGHSPSMRLHKQADRAEAAGEAREAYELRIMAEHAEDEEDRADIARFLS